jgi:disulfide bond formation protein DsbB
MFLSAPTSLFHQRVAIFLMLAMAAVVGTALAFEHLGGYLPCKLCLEQRWPYYFGAPVMALAAFNAWRNLSSTLTRSLLVIGAALMGYGLYLSVFHAGVEWAWWPGPTDCAAAATKIETDAGNLLESMNKTRPPSCNEAALRVLGLSFAGWNVIASAILMTVAIRSAVRA